MTRELRSRFTRAGVLALALSVMTAAGAQAQNAVINGTVRSSLGEVLEGSNVFIQTLQVSAVTNAAGRYSLLIPGDRVRGQTVTVTARRIGFAPATREIVLTATTQEIDFELRIDPNRLTEVIVTGVTAGTQQAKVPFSVARIDASDLPVPAVDPIGQLQGKVPGVTIVQSGRPGAPPAVILRGPSSLNAEGRGQEPLYIVDGVIIAGQVPDINPLDIQNIEVVKGAAAASLYGARAGNGVIQITTKSGKDMPDGIRFGVRSEIGVSDVEREMEIARQHALTMDPSGTRFCTAPSGEVSCARTIDYQTELARVNNVSGTSAGTPPSLVGDIRSTTAGAVLKRRFQANPWPGETYSAVNQVVKPSLFNNTSLDMTGRVGGTAFFASASWLDQEGAIQFLEGFQRQSARLNLDQDIGDKWNVSLRTFYSRGESDGTNHDVSGGAFFRLSRVPGSTNILARDSLGRLYIRTNLRLAGDQNENPLQLLQHSLRDDKSDRFIGGGTVTYRPFEWLDVDGNFSYDGRRHRVNEFEDKGYRTTLPDPDRSNGAIFEASVGSQSFNTSGNVTARWDPTPTLRTRTSLRYLYERQDNDLNWTQGDQLAVQGVRSVLNSTNILTYNSTFESIRQIGLFAGVNLEYDERYILDALVRRDGSSLFGADNRWATFGRVSGAWRLSEEPWWTVPAANEVKLRASYGTAGGRPPFEAQYETFTIGRGGNVAPATAGNSQLRPEIITEAEVGADVELFSRFGLMATYAQSAAEDQILPVPAPGSTGFVLQWRNAGRIENTTWEASLNVPIVTRRDVSWSTRLTYDRTRSKIARLDVPDFPYGLPQTTRSEGTDIGTGSIAQAADAMFLAKEGEEMGAIYGRKFLNSCSELPAPYATQCGGATSAFQINDDGFVVWVGEGNSWRDGITSNLWEAVLPGTVAPWGTTLNWGMPIIFRTDAGTPQTVKLGGALPDYKWAWSNTVTYRRFSAYGLIDASIGRDVWNQARHWAYLEQMNAEADQGDKSVETAKPVGYYFRGAPPDHPNGVGGLYNALLPNSHFVEDASFAKVRELALTYRIGQIAGNGDWTIGLVGRNLYTFTDYHGFDPEVGVAGGEAGSPVLNAIDGFSFPNTRSFTLSFSSRF